MKVVQKRFTPGETEAASGRSVDSQRTDRRMGFEPENIGHGRYDLFRIAKFFVREQLSKRGIGPSKSAIFLDEVAQHVAYHAACSPQSWSTAAEAHLYSPQPVPEELEGTAAGAMEKVVNDVRQYFVPHDLVTLSGVPVPEGGGPLGKGLVVWANGEHTIQIGFWREYGRLFPWDPRGMGAIVMLPFHAAGTLLASQLPRPILDIEEED